MTDEKKPLILLTGGGTLGPVTPLLALVEEARNSGCAMEFHWVGTPTGAERALVAQYTIPFSALPEAKLRRYWDWRTLLLPVTLVHSTAEAWRLVRSLRPTAVVTAGGYTGVPVSFAAWWYRIPVVSHEQDVITLSARLVRPIAYRRTSVWPRAGAKTIGNPVRSSVSSATALVNNSHPRIVILGGGTGSKGLNELVSPLLSELVEVAKVVHVTGHGKSDDDFKHKNYSATPFMREGIGQLLAEATVVISRAGMGTLAELAAHAVPTIIVPMPDTHQEANALKIASAKAARVVHQHQGGEVLKATIRELLRDIALRQRLGSALRACIPNGSKAFLAEVEGVVSSVR